MLAEIFMVRLETEARLAEEVLPSSTSRFIPFSPRSQFVFFFGPPGRESSKQRAACQSGPVIEERPRSELVLTRL